MNNLPRDIVADILSRLPLVSLLQCRAVCTTFRNAIHHDPLLARMHLIQASHSRRLPSLLFSQNNKLYLVDFGIGYNAENPKVTAGAVGICFSPTAAAGNGHLEFDSILSCHGLVCLCEPSTCNPICVANPLTADHVMLPPPSSTSSTATRFNTGFGFDASTKEYKVVRMHVDHECGAQPGPAELVAEVYTVGSAGATWRTVASPPYLLYHDGTNDAVNVDGAIHWLGRHSSGAQANYPELIVAWDVTQEEFYEIPFPREISGVIDIVTRFSISLQRYRNCLAMFHFHDEQTMTVWLLRAHRSRVKTKRQWIRKQKRIPSIRDWDWDERRTVEARIQRWYGCTAGAAAADVAVKASYGRGEGTYLYAEAQGRSGGTWMEHIFHSAAHVGSFYPCTTPRTCV